MSMLDQMVRRFARPLLLAEGFEPVPVRAFVKMVEGGSAACVQFRRTSGRPPAELFYFEASVLPRPDIEWREYVDQSEMTLEKIPDEGGRYFRRFPPPERVDAHAPERSTHEYWLLHPTYSTVEVCGSIVEQTLRDDVLPLLQRLMDRQQFIAAQSAGVPGVRRDKMSQILLRLPDGDSAQIEALIDSMISGSASWADSGFIKWVRARLANDGATR